MKSTLEYKDILQQLKRREDILRILIFTIFTVFCWVGFSIFLSQQTTKVSPESRTQAIPLNPNIDRETINEIQSRRVLSEQELESFPIYTKVTDIDGNSFIVEKGTVLTESEIPLTATSASTISPSPTPTSSPIPDEQEDDDETVNDGV